MERMRLNKYIAGCGICSRREADRLIEDGRVLVDGRPAQMGMTVDGSEVVTVDGTPVSEKERKVLLLYHKPVGVVCTEKDPHAERTIATEVHYPIRVTYAGRLDKDSRGLLLLTNDGELIEELMRGANGHEKEYIVQVNKPVSADDLDKMEKGVYLKELDTVTRPCVTQKTGDRTFRIVLTQGLNRQIRRMCKVLGYHVTDLKRVRVANLELGELPEGKWRDATEEEIRVLRKLLKGKNGTVGVTE